MPRVPFIGRLFFREYLALLASLLLIGLEVFARIFTLALPGPILRFLYNQSRNLFNLLSSPQGRKARGRQKSITSSIAHGSDFVDLCDVFGYYAEEHIVQTGDGYLLGLHRLGWKKGEEDQRVNSGPGSIQKKVVYLHHGLMMNSEVWVCMTEEERCLPFRLVEKGYDVWFGNNRGNKYSKKAIRYSPTQTPFWNFSMDQFAFHDIPDSIDYILSTTKQQSLSYIGFSQGTAQAFATLSIHPTLNEKVDVFIALAPAMAPAGMANGIVDSFVKASPELLFLAFGRRSMLSSVTMWQALLYPPIFVRLIDISLSFLFGWNAQNITQHQKLAAYPHLYSYTSVKSVVHWFQIIGNGTFRMYNDEVQAPLRLGGNGKFSKVPKFPTRNIKTPIVLIYGGSDSLVDINVMLKELPKHTVAKEIPHYEHLDLLWASDVDSLVFPDVFDALDFYANADRVKEKGREAKVNRRISATSQPPTYSEDENTKAKHRLSASVNSIETDGFSDLASPKTRERSTRKSATRPTVPRISSSAASWSPAPSHTTGGVSEHSSRPEGWWSSEEDSPRPGTPSRSRPSKESPDGPSASKSVKTIAGGMEQHNGESGSRAEALKTLQGIFSRDWAAQDAANRPVDESKAKKRKKPPEFSQ